MLLAATFVPWSLLAQTPTPCISNKTKCELWPCDANQTVQGCQQSRKNVEQMFVALLNDASAATPAGKQLREDLLCSANGFEKAHAEVQKRLKALPISVSFGDEHHVAFYEPENAVPETGGSFGNDTDSPDNHCLHIFYLQEVGKTLENDTPVKTLKSFNRHLKCCYQPWRPQ